MPTTATVAPGLRELASFLDTHPDVLTLRRSPDVKLQLGFILVDAEAVHSLAQRLGTEVTATTLDDSTHVGTVAAFAGVEVSFFAINETPRVLRRGPEATAILAERDA